MGYENSKRMDHHYDVLRCIMPKLPVSMDPVAFTMELPVTRPGRMFSLRGEATYSYD